MGQEGVEIVEKVPVSIGDSSRAKDEDSLLVPLDDAVTGWRFGGG